MDRPKLLTANNKGLAIAQTLSPRAPQTTNESLALATFATLVSRGEGGYILPYSYVDTASGLRYRSEGNMDAVHAAVESPEGLELRKRVNAVLSLELGVQAVHGHDCNDCLLPLGEDPSELWIADQELRSRSAALAPTVVLPSFEQVAQIAGVPQEVADQDRAFFESVASLASELSPKKLADLAA